jgi:hypothetical protein
VRSFVCCVSFDRGVILCYVCYLFVVSYCKPLPPGKNPFAVNKYYIQLSNSLFTSIQSFSTIYCYVYTQCCSPVISDVLYIVDEINEECYMCLSVCLVCPSVCPHINSKTI